jgi:hypothetical protein
MLGLSAASWTVFSVVLGIAGLLLLFRYGMPYRIESGGFDHVVVGAANAAEEERLDNRYKRFGFLGLVLTIAGGVCQILGAYS